jgi:integrase
MIIAALDTGMRQGEMLALRFGDIDWKRQLIVLRGITTKSKRTRVVPISTTRLKAVLEWLRLDADNDRKPDDALVFSDEISQPIGRFRTAWVTAVLKAHGVKPEWKSYNWTALTAACQQAFKEINLHWHDLRHEYASRLVESGVPLAQVRDLLGHASIITTERYDNQKVENLQLVASKLERGLMFNVPAPGEPDGRPKPETSDQLGPSAATRPIRARASVSWRAACQNRGAKNDVVLRGNALLTSSRPARLHKRLML